MRKLIPNKWLRLALGLSVAFSGIALYALLDSPVEWLGLVLAFIGAFITPTVWEFTNKGR